jgi:hypothetical protein
MEPRLPMAHRLIAEGKLPAHNTLRTYGGRSAGSVCRLCGKPLSAGAPEIEIVEPGPPEFSAFLHPDCHAIWLAAVQTEDPKA